MAFLFLPLRTVDGEADGAAGRGPLTAAQHAERRFRDLQQALRAVAAELPAFGDRLALPAGLVGDAGIGVGDLARGEVDEGQRQFRIAKPHRQRHGVEERRQVPVVEPRRVDRGDAVASAVTPGAPGVSNVAQPHHVGQGLSVVGFGAGADRLKAPPPGRQQKVERRSPGAQQRNTLFESAERIALEAGADVLIMGLGAGIQIEQHREAPRAREAAVDVIPQE